MGLNKRLLIGGAAEEAFDPLKNFETVTYTGNGGTQKITGYIRKGAAFNGSSSKITIAELDNVSAISCWVNPSDDSGIHALFGHSSDTTSFFYFYNTGQTSGQMRFSGASLSAFTTPSYTIDADTWTHLVITEDGSDVKVYVNKNLAATFSSNSFGDINEIGARTAGTDQFLKGKLDQVRIFDKALSSAEITTLYNETYDSSTKSTTDIFSDGSGVALYELDEDAKDTDGVDGKFNNAAVFNGSTSYIDTNLPSLTNTFSFSAWLYLEDLSTTYRWIFANWASSAQDLYMMIRDTGKIELNADGNNGNLLFGSSGTFTLNTWHHLAVTMNAGAYTVYLNNVSLGSGSTTNTTFNNSNDFQLGKAPNSSINEWNGKMDDVRVYSDALTTDEIGYLYNNTTASIPTDNLTLHYKLDGNLTDETGNYNGTGTNITYTGYNGTPTNVNFLGMAFQPDLVWIKNRDNTNNHAIYDSIRGNYFLQSSTTNQEQTSVANTLSSFDTNGFTVSGGGNAINGSYDYVAWCWKAGGSAVSNTDGSITSQVSANPDAGFSIVKFSPNLANDESGTVGHGLSSAPQLIITKTLDLTLNWWTSIDGITGTQDDYVALNLTNAVNNIGDPFGRATNDVFSISQAFVGSSSNTIAYCFHSVDGYQKVGSYTGGSTSTKSTGFKPRFLLVKQTNASGQDWHLFDSVRGGGDTFDEFLKPNTSDQESSASNREVNFTSDGFNFSEATSNAVNTSGNTYIYLAIA